LAVGASTFAAENRWREQQRDAQQESVFRAVGTLRARLEGLLGQQIYMLKGLATHIGLNPDISEQQFSRFVEDSLPQNSVVSIVAAAPNLIVKHIYPLEGNESVLGLNYRARNDQRHAAMLAIERKDVVLAGPLPLVQGGVGFVARVPVFMFDDSSQETTKLWGLVAAVILTDTLYKEAGLLSDELEMEVALRGLDASGPDGPIFFGDEALFSTDSGAVYVPIDFARGAWQMAAQPIGGWGPKSLIVIWTIRFVGASIAGGLLLVLWAKRRFAKKTEIAEQNFKDLFELNNDAIFITNAESLEILDVNQRAERHVGYDRSELLGRRITEIYTRESELDLYHIVKTLAEQGHIVFETLHRRKDGELVPVEVSSRRLTRPTGDILISAVRNISDRKAAEAALRKSRQDLVSAIESINEGFALWDPSGHLQLFNQRYFDLAPELQDIIKVGVSFREMLIATYGQGLITTDFDHDEWIEMRLEEHKRPTGPYEFRTADGRYIKISEYLTPDGSCVGVYEDITDLKRATEHVHYRAYFDVLTGLPNRENFLGKLTETLAVTKRSGQIVGLLFVDLDRFKSTNDSLGHAVGDALLREVALRLRVSVRETDFVARFAGDEFVVLLRYVDQPINAANIAENLLAKLNTPYVLDGHDVYGSASIGIAIAPNDTVEAETLLKYADLAMYQAKAVGGNAFRFFTANMTQRAQRFVAIEKDLRQSITENQCQLHYQPAFDLKTNLVCSAEALVRWQHPELGLMLPDEFIPIAEETGFINELGRWVIGEATQQSVNWRSVNNQTALKIAVNVSSRQFWGDFDTGFVRGLIAQANFPANRLIIEITESLVIGEEHGIIHVLEELRDLGVEICIDDFGTGYSAISYLKRLPVTMLKIDKSFVADIERSLDDALLVASIVAMAKALRVKVVAEGIETEAQRDMSCAFT